MQILPVIKYDQLLNNLLSLKSKRYFEVARRYKHCFTGNIENNVASANKTIMSIPSNNIGHVVSSAFVYAFNQFYGLEFNPKLIKRRSYEVSKFTTRLTVDEIKLTKQRILDWIKDANNIQNNTRAYIKSTRIRFLYIFEVFLYTGMRAGELGLIDFGQSTRMVKSSISKETYVEMVINTEKTSKKREIYLPANVYIYFLMDRKKIKRK